MPTLLCRNELKILLRSAICFSDHEALVTYMNSQDTMPSWDIIFLTMPELRSRYRQALVALHRELVPNHISSEDIYKKLWGLFKEVALDVKSYQTGQSLNQKISEFCNDVKKPLQIVDIIYEIKNFDVGSIRLDLCNVEIFKVTEGDLHKLGLKRGASALQNNIFKEWLGKSVAKTEVSVSDIDRAYESGFSAVNSVLDTVRLVAVRERIGRPLDEMFLWELDRSITIPKVKPKSGIALSTSYYRGSRPLIVPMDQTVLKGLDNLRSWQYILDGNLPEDINNRITRAIRWISHAITSSDLDYKLVDLCSALEIMLLPDYTGGRKGELIALRQLLVGSGSYTTPAAILNLYEKRSNIIHRGTLKITSYSDYWHLLLCCFEVLNNIIEISRQNPGLVLLKNLLGTVENSETLQSFIENCKLVFYEGDSIDKIKKAAENRLGEL
jgi:hypothetical protein